VPFGDLSFTSDISGNAAAAYMLGYPRTVLTPEGLPISAARQWRYAFYFQDDWKATSKLTINLGVRYDLLLVPKDINGNTRTLRFDLDSAGPVLWPQQGQAAELWKQEYWHIAPRVGFAYRLRGDTVIRRVRHFHYGASIQ
jgi:outer membrane receptor protein involved in Fe transport